MTDKTQWLSIRLTDEQMTKLREFAETLFGQGTRRRQGDVVRMLINHAKLEDLLSPEMRERIKA